MKWWSYIVGFAIQWQDTDRTNGDKRLQRSATLRQVPFHAQTEAIPSAVPWQNLQQLITQGHSASDAILNILKSLLRFTPFARVPEVGGGDGGAVGPLPWDLEGGKGGWCCPSTIIKWHHKHMNLNLRRRMEKENDKFVTLLQWNLGQNHSCKLVGHLNDILSRCCLQLVFLTNFSKFLSLVMLK